MSLIEIARRNRLRALATLAERKFSDELFEKAEYAWGEKASHQRQWNSSSIDLRGVS
ncbi:hypothetical protein [Falsiphaeobacter marinintestinus]|uniref:hypothetical protein n=1 Tax=Falsiphaeobacter marinintestinus TaxID=1492905 RepID=UPI001646CE17|nr:hypothetical protein [Phaeobacter marinintestinus]